MGRVPSKSEISGLRSSAEPGETDPNSSRYGIVEGRSAAEVFKGDITVIRESVRGDTGQLDLGNILSRRLICSPFIAKFAPEVQSEWAGIITRLMVAAKDAMAKGAREDFYATFRDLKEQEELKPAAKKLLFIERFSNALPGEYFSAKGENNVETWKVLRCSSTELSGAAPQLLVENEATGEAKNMQLIDIMAGLKV